MAERTTFPCKPDSGTMTKKICGVERLARRTEGNLAFYSWTTTRLSTT